jgi:hypothetical protein
LSIEFRAFLFGSLFGVLGFLTWPTFGGSTSARDVVRLEGSGGSRGATVMGVAGELPPCSIVLVKPPSVVADFGSPTGLDEIKMSVESCAGARPASGGSWSFETNDSWKSRKALKIADSPTGGPFECIMSWEMIGKGSGPVDFIAEWNIVKLEEENCKLMSKR